MLEARKVFIFGYSGHAYVIIESFLAAGYSIGGYFDFEENQLNPYQLPYFGFEGRVDVNAIVEDNFVFPSVGDNKIRAKLIAFFEKHNLKQCSIIDPTAQVSATAKIETSSYIGKNACVNAQVKIQKGAIINTAAIIEHECNIRPFSHISPGAVLCGNVEIGEYAFIGANAVVRNNISICAEAVVGAGGVVVKSISDKGTWVGNPSKKLL